jgi:DNA-binding GntR family transcriptional regulator
MEFRFAALTASANPALLLVLEIIRRQAAGSLDAFAATAADMPWDETVHRRIHAAYVEVTDALEAGDAARAASVWRRHLKRTSPFFRSRLGDRLIVDLVDY